MGPLQFLNVLPTGDPTGQIADPSAFFSMSLEASGGMFSSAFGMGEAAAVTPGGDQWASLMRETGIFDAQGGFRPGGAGFGTANPEAPFPPF